MQQENKKIKTVYIVICYVAVFVLIAAFEILGYVSYSKGFNKALEEKTKVVHVDFRQDVIADDYPDSKFPFLKIEYSHYITKMCTELDLDPYLCVSILLRENPQFDTKAIHENNNGTFDLGLWQLNSKYVWSTFKDRYWTFDFDLDPMNWKHNTYIALCHIRYLFDTLKVEEDVIQAYNCGEYAVMNDRIPDSTIAYLAAVKLNYLLINVEG